METAALDTTRLTNRVPLYSRAASYDERELLSSMIPSRCSIASSRCTPPENALSVNLAVYQGAGEVVSFFYPAVTFDAVKRITDIFLSIAAIIILSPVMLAAAAAVKFSSPGPVIFRQRRLTAGGKVFTMYKFRTMRADAEDKTGAVFASVADSRATRIGSFLRHYHIDELPQLFNVLAGDMSIVGPRPERPELASELSRSLPRFEERMDVKAGITGLAQTSTGYAASVKAYRRKLRCDLIYVRQRSLGLDLYIMWRTVGLIVQKDSAAR